MFAPRSHASALCLSSTAATTVGTLDNSVKTAPFHLDPKYLAESTPGSLNQRSTREAPSKAAVTLPKASPLS